MIYDPSQVSPSLQALTKSIFDYAARTSADDIRDDSFVTAAGLQDVLTVRAHQDLLALYLFALLVLVPPSSAGTNTLTEDEQRDLFHAVWYEYYLLHLSLGALTSEQIQAKTEALVTRWDDIYEFYQQARFEQADPEWGTSVIRFFLQDLEGVVDPSPQQVNTLASRVTYLTRTFPATIDGGQATSPKGRLSRLLRQLSTRN